MGGYSYMDFVRVGLPLNLVTWAVACTVIPMACPF
jgi:di/tricarboxylate transporter